MLRVKTTTRLSSQIFKRFNATSTNAARTPMFCMQCEQTEHHTGCTTVGNCGKTPETAHLQDLLVYSLKGLAQYTSRARKVGVPDSSLVDIDRFTIQSLFSTMTNVNFDSARFQIMIKQALQHRNKALQLYQQKSNSSVAPPMMGTPSTWNPIDINSIDMLEKEASTIDIQTRRKIVPEDALGLQELLTYGLKGTSAYATHAAELGMEDPAVFKAIGESLAMLGDNATNPNPDVNDLVGHVLKCGETNLRVMQLLDQGHTTRFGDPSPHVVNTNEVPGKAILVSGHDLPDLEALLQQTEGKGINVYTHGEMLPAHGYPELRKYKHLVGNYGGAWQLQKMEFGRFPGPIVMTTNCIIEPRDSYKDRIYTRGEVGWPGVKHLTSRDFSQVINQALSMEGFKNATTKNKPITVGFGHKTVLSVADKVLTAAKSGELSHIFLIGGCDGSEGERSYYRKLAEKSPANSLLLTLGCGKFRINHKDYGTLGSTGIPRLLDMGQCNDSYGAIVVASELAKALKTDVNSLPLSLALSWFEQKAVAVLLTLLHLNIQNIRIGPALPAFVTPSTLNLLVEKFKLKPVNVDNVDQDLALMMKNN